LIPTQDPADVSVKLGPGEIDPIKTRSTLLLVKHEVPVRDAFTFEIDQVLPPIGYSP
jgi:hypothetical protein